MIKTGELIGGCVHVVIAPPSCPNMVTSGLINPRWRLPQCPNSRLQNSGGWTFTSLCASSRIFQQRCLQIMQLKFPKSAKCFNVKCCHHICLDHGRVEQHVKSCGFRIRCGCPHDSGHLLQSVISLKCSY